MSDELKPCKVCGKPGKRNAMLRLPYSYDYVSCDNCGCNVPYEFWQTETPAERSIKATLKRLDSAANHPGRCCGAYQKSADILREELANEGVTL